MPLGRHRLRDATRLTITGCAAAVAEWTPDDGEQRSVLFQYTQAPLQHFHWHSGAAELTNLPSDAAQGAYLSQPVTEKETVSGEGKTVEYGVSSMQGWRRTMEDGERFPFNRLTVEGGLSSEPG